EVYPGTVVYPRREENLAFYKTYLEKMIIECFDAKKADHLPQEVDEIGPLYEKAVHEAAQLYLDSAEFPELEELRKKLIKDYMVSDAVGHSKARARFAMRMLELLLEDDRIAVWEPLLEMAKKYMTVFARLVQILETDKIQSAPSRLKYEIFRSLAHMAKDAKPLYDTGIVVDQKEMSGTVRIDISASDSSRSEARSILPDSKREGVNDVTVDPDLLRKALSLTRFTVPDDFRLNLAERAVIDLLKEKEEEMYQILAAQMGITGNQKLTLHLIDLEGDSTYKVVYQCVISTSNGQQLAFGVRFYRENIEKARQEIEKMNALAEMMPGEIIRSWVFWKAQDFNGKIRLGSSGNDVFSIVSVGEFRNGHSLLQRLISLPQSEIPLLLSAFGQFAARMWAASLKNIGGELLGYFDTDHTKWNTNFGVDNKMVVFFFDGGFLNWVSLAHLFSIVCLITAMSDGFYQGFWGRLKAIVMNKELNVSELSIRRRLIADNLVQPLAQLLVEHDQMTAAEKKRIRSEIRNSDSNPSEYEIEGNISRDLDELNLAYGLSDELKARKGDPQILLIGVGRGYAAIELALKFPNVNIVAINKEQGVWDDAKIENGMQSKGYDSEAIRRARNRISLKILDIEDEAARKKLLGNQLFDFVVFETRTQLYMQDKVKIIQDLFNEKLKVGGIYAFVIDNVYLSGSEKGEVSRIIRSAFKKSALLKREDHSMIIYPRLTYEKTSDRVDIPLILDTYKDNTNRLPIAHSYYFRVVDSREGKPTLREGDTAELKGWNEAMESWKEELRKKPVQIASKIQLAMKPETTLEILFDKPLAFQQFGRTVLLKRENMEEELTFVPNLDFPWRAYDFGPLEMAGVFYLSHDHDEKMYAAQLTEDQKFLRFRRLTDALNTDAAKLPAVPVRIRRGRIGNIYTVKLSDLIRAFGRDAEQLSWMTATNLQEQSSSTIEPSQVRSEMRDSSTEDEGLKKWNEAFRRLVQDEVSKRSYIEKSHQIRSGKAEEVRKSGDIYRSLFIGNGIDPYPLLEVKKLQAASYIIDKEYSGGAYVVVLKRHARALGVAMTDIRKRDAGALKKGEAGVRFSNALVRYGPKVADLPKELGFRAGYNVFDHISVLDFFDGQGLTEFLSHGKVSAGEAEVFYRKLLQWVKSEGTVEISEEGFPPVTVSPLKVLMQTSSPGFFASESIQDIHLPEQKGTAILERLLDTSGFRFKKIWVGETEIEKDPIFLYTVYKTPASFRSEIRGNQTQDQRPAVNTPNQDRPKVQETGLSSYPVLNDKTLADAFHFYGNIGAWNIWVQDIVRLTGKNDRQIKEEFLKHMNDSVKSGKKEIWRLGTIPEEHWIYLLPFAKQVLEHNGTPFFIERTMHLLGELWVPFVRKLGTLGIALPEEYESEKVAGISQMVRQYAPDRRFSTLAATILSFLSREDIGSQISEGQKAILRFEWAKLPAADRETINVYLKGAWAIDDFEELLKSDLSVGSLVKTIADAGVAPSYIHMQARLDAFVRILEQSYSRSSEIPLTFTRIKSELAKANQSLHPLVRFRNSDINELEDIFLEIGFAKGEILRDTGNFFNSNVWIQFIEAYLKRHDMNKAALTAQHLVRPLLVPVISELESVRKRFRGKPIVFYDDALGGGGTAIAARFYAALFSPGQPHKFGVFFSRPQKFTARTLEDFYGSREIMMLEDQSDRHDAIFKKVESVGPEAVPLRAKVSYQELEQDWLEQSKGVARRDDIYLEYSRLIDGILQRYDAELFHDLRYLLHARKSEVLDLGQTIVKIYLWSKQDPDRELFYDLLIRNYFVSHVGELTQINWDLRTLVRTDIDTVLARLEQSENAHQQVFAQLRQIEERVRSYDKARILQALDTERKLIAARQSRALNLLDDPLIQKLVKNYFEGHIDFETIRQGIMEKADFGKFSVRSEARDQVSAYEDDLDYRRMLEKGRQYTHADVLMSPEEKVRETIEKLRSKITPAEFKALDGKTILVPGFGEHWQELETLAGFFPTSKIVGVDWLQRCVDLARKNVRAANVEIIQDDIRSWSPAGRPPIGLIFVSYVLEHTLWEDNEEVLKRLVRTVAELVADDGFLITIPSTQYIVLPEFKKLGFVPLHEESAGLGTVFIAKKMVTADRGAASRAGMRGIKSDRRSETIGRSQQPGGIVQPVPNVPGTVQKNRPETRNDAVDRAY
ncbi:MAG: hypothetical protein WC484_05790, partial [Candidatus Omnitrophota bacterium]